MFAKKKEEIIEIKPMEIVTAKIRIVGDTPLIIHKWSEKAKRMMLEAQTKAVKTKAREAKNPVEDFIDSLYWISGEPTEKTEAAFERAVEKGARWGFPVTGIKKATIDAAYRNGLAKDKASLRGVFFIESEGPELLAEIKGCAPVMREDMVRIGQGVADMRFRGMFTDWYMDLTIQFNKSGKYTLDQIVNLINVGGFACGIGEQRPSRDGQNGMYHVAGSV